MKILMLTLLAFVSAADESHPTGYRVIFTSPRELSNALKQPLPPHQKKDAPMNVEAGTRSLTRLQKFFFVKHKSVDGADITLEVQPTLPLLSSELADVTSLTLKLHELVRTEDKFVYSVNITTNQGAKIVTQMTVTPSKFGSLLKLELLSQSVWTEIFTKIASALEIVAKTPEEADAKAQRVGL